MRISQGVLAYRSGVEVKISQGVLSYRTIVEVKISQGYETIGEE